MAELSHGRRWGHRWWPEALIVLAFLLLTAGMTWPMVGRLGTHFAGHQDMDVWLNFWASWWTKRVLSGEGTLYYTDHLFYPHGAGLAFHSFSHVTTALTLMGEPLLGLLGAHNAAILLAYALSGYSMFCLVRYLSHSTRGAFFAGLIFAFLPYRLAESPRPHLMSAQWLPWYALFLVRLVREGRRRHLVPAALFFVLNALSGWHLMTFALFLSAVYLAYLLVWEREHLSWRTGGTLVLLGLMASLPLLPFLLPMLRERLATAEAYTSVPLEVGWGNDLLAFFLPHAEHPMLGPALEPLRARIDPLHPAYLGFTALGFSLIGALRRWRRVRFWVLLGLLSALFSLGPSVKILGYEPGVRWPWAALEVALLRHPLRFNLLIGMAVAVSGGFGLAYGVQRLRRRPPRRRRALFGGAILLLLFEYLHVPFPTTAAIAPRAYATWLNASVHPGAVLSLPMGSQRSKYYMYYQTLHRRPLVEGHVSRTPEETYAFIEGTPVLRSLRACGELSLPPAAFSVAATDLARYGITHLVVHKDLVQPASWERWVHSRAHAPRYEDETLAVYDLTDAHRYRPGVPQLVEGCIAVRTALSATQTLIQGERLEVPLTWDATVRPAEAYVLHLALTEPDGARVQSHQYAVMAERSTREWPMGARYAVDYVFQVDPWLAPGSYDLRAALVPAEQPAREVLWARLARVDVRARPRNFTLPASERDVGAVYGGVLRLLGYDLELEGQEVTVRPYWQAVRRMDEDYKFFVHLYDADSGALVAQVDGMPRDWSYPTSWWAEGEVVADRVTLCTAHLPAGEYRLRLGVYDPQAGRLAVEEAPAAFDVRDGALVLPEEVVR